MPKCREEVINPHEPQSRYINNSPAELLRASWGHTIATPELVERRLDSIAFSRLLSLAQSNGYWQKYFATQASEFLKWVADFSNSSIENQDAAINAGNLTVDTNLKFRSELIELLDNIEIVRFVIKQNHAADHTSTINFKPMLEKVEYFEAEIKKVLTIRRTLLALIEKFLWQVETSSENDDVTIGAVVDLLNAYLLEEAYLSLELAQTSSTIKIRSLGGVQASPDDIHPTLATPPSKQV